MSGSCYSCATQFGYFKKEHGCKNCGYSFCKECVHKKIAIPKYKNEKHKVCNRCFDILSGNLDPLKQQPKYSPPEALKKRLAALENNDKQNKPVTGQKSQTQKVNAKYKGMDSKDIAIAERLEKLKEERRKEAGPVPSQNEIEKRLEGLKEKGPPPPTDSEMTKRLAVLKGQDPTQTTKPFVHKPDRRTEQQQIDDLLDEICDEVEIDSHGIDAVEDVSSRLRHLKGQNESADQHYTQANPNLNKVKNTESDENKDIDEINRLMKEVAQEMELDAKRAIEGLENDKELMSRLNQLKKDRDKKEGSLNENNDDNSDENEDSDDEEQAIKRILKQSLAEARLDEDLEASNDASNKSKKNKAPERTDDKETQKKTNIKKDDDELESDPDEFPWCCICNEDASIRCLGCDYDLYCNRCYKEGHDLLDMKDHKTVPYKQKR